MSEFSVKEISSRAGSAINFSQGIKSAGTSYGTTLYHVHSQSSEPSNPSDGALWWTGSTLRHWIESKWREIPVALPPSWFGERALVFGGDKNASPYYDNSISYYQIPTLGNATDFGDMTQTRTGGASLSDASRAVSAAGNSGSSKFNTIDYVTIGTLGNSIDFGDLSFYTTEISSTSSGARGLFIGGYGGSAAHLNYMLGRIHYITIATPANSGTFGDLHTGPVGNAYVSARSTCAWGNAARFVVAGGDTGSVTGTNRLLYGSYTTLANTNTFGTLTVTKTGASAGGSKSRMLIGSGDWRNPRQYQNVIEYIAPSTLGNATDFGDLAARNVYACGPNLSSDSYKCCWNGGTGAASGTSGRQNNIQYVTVATPGNSVDFGDLLYGRKSTSSASGG